LGCVFSICLSPQGQRESKIPFNDQPYSVKAFNVGIAIGAFVGGIIVDTIGIIHTPWIGGGMVFGAVLLTAWSSSLEKRDA
jgi:predicted MFS family arabinose efflux permease